jgi:hypothetical protein
MPPGHLRLAAAFVFAAVAPAWGQTTTEVSDVAAGTDQMESMGELPAPSFWEGGGVRVTEGTVLHPTVQVAGAYQTNVFFQDGDDGPDGPISAAVARFSVGASWGTVSPGRMELEAPSGDVRPRLAFDIDAMLTWNQFISGDDAVSDQSDLGIGLNAEATFNPRGKVQLMVRDAFIRNVNPGQSLREDLDRDRNELTGRLSVFPGGGAIEGYLGYTFIIDVFESSVLLFEDRMTHTGFLGARWQWLPKTQIGLEASIGMVSPSNDAIKSASTPLRVVASASTLFTPAVGLITRAGYGNGFYESGENVSTWLAAAELRLALGPTLRFAAGYNHDFADGLVGNFYTDHQIYARGAWQLLDRWQIRVSGDLRFRSYGGIRDTETINLCGDASCADFRDDVLTRVEAGVEYQITPWMFGSVGYSLNTDSTDFFVRGSSADDSGSYVANEVFAKVSARF